MISYCIASFRPRYSRMLIEDLIQKTTVPFEILIWLNIDDPDYEAFLRAQIGRSTPLRVVGKTPENIGMRAYGLLFMRARYELIVQIDDDVVSVSRQIAEQALDIFRAFPEVKQLVADVWQDEYTTGARPPLSAYRLFNKDYGLYEGPIDGWFSIFHRSILDLVPVPHAEYVPLGSLLKNRLRAKGMRGLLCTRFRVFHVIGPEYAWHFGMLEAEIEKYRRLGRSDIVHWYEEKKDSLPPASDLHARVHGIRKFLDMYSGVRRDSASP